jgi:flagellar hook protein FlgE
MSFLRSLYSGVSGLKNHQVMMDVIGNNIANINTVGYKSGRVTFSETFSQMMQNATQPFSGTGGANPIQVGLGMAVNSVDTIFSQGNLETTGQSTDLAIQGNAFFIVKKGGKSCYTRAGEFQFDANGMLVNPGTGAILQGKLADANGVIPTGTRMEDIRIALDQKSPAHATSTIKFSGNLNSDASVAMTTLSGTLDSSAAVGTTYTQTIAMTDDLGVSHDVTYTLTKTAANTYSVNVTATNGSVTGGTGTATFDATTGSLTSFTPASITLVPAGGAPPMSINLDGSALTEVTGSSSFIANLEKTADTTDAAISIYDSLGNRHTVTVTFTKSANQNEWTWAANVEAPATITGGRSGRVLFNSDGTLRAFSYDDGSTALSIEPHNGAEPIAIDLNFGTANSFTGITQIQGDSTVTPREQDGYSAGVMTNISIDTSGKIIGTFSNGAVMNLGQVLLAEFNNPGGLVKLGDNLYDISGNSGTPAIVEAGISTSSTITSGALEQSNVDLSEEFTRMITAQRGFQANARIITTSDEFLQEIVNMKR